MTLPHSWQRMARAWRDQILDQATIAEIRLRARLAAIPGAFDGAQAGPAHGLFLHHEANAATERHFARLIAETEGLIVWHRVYNPDGGAAPQTDLVYQHPSLLMPWRFDEMVKNGGRVQGGLADLAILPSVLATGARFVWVMEYDVEFAGAWGGFFAQFANNRADLLTTMLATHAESADWPHWPATRVPPGIHPIRRLRSFNPLMRMTRRFALGYIAALRDPHWRGHYEFTLPTVAVKGGFSVEDLGGKGRLCPPRRRGRNYTATPDHSTLGPGSFVWRPVIPGYRADRPDLFPVEGLLYHPCKAGVPAWEEVAARGQHGSPPVPKPEPRVAVVMCTCDGAAHLAEQLASLASQTRRPDEVIIGDDASTDGTMALLRSFAATAPFPVTIVERPNRLGYAANFIATVQATTGDLIFFCDQDDVWDARKIEIVVSAAQVDSALVYSHDLTIFRDRPGTDEAPILSYFDHLRHLGLDPSLCCKGCGLAVRAELIRALGWPPPSSTMSHDAWIALLATALGQRSLIEAPLVRHRIHAGNASGWVVSAKEKRQKAKSPAGQPFASMLDFYIGDWNRDWVDTLRERLEAVGMQIDFVKAREASLTLEKRSARGS